MNLHNLHRSYWRAPRKRLAAFSPTLLLLITACAGSDQSVGDSATTTESTTETAIETGAPSSQLEASNAGQQAAARTDASLAAVMQLEPLEFPAPTLEVLRTSLQAYEAVRAQLAADRLDTLISRARRLSQSLELASQGLPEDTASEHVRSLEEAAAAAISIAQASDLETARAAFGEVSRFLILLVSADPRLTEGWRVFSCPMAETFPKWMQPTDEIENPFMGTAMPTCGAASDWTVPAPASHSEVEAHAHAAHGGDIAHYTCSMHPSVKQEGPGTCPICSMTLTPVTREEVDTGMIVVDAQRRQTIGVRTSPVTVRQANVTIRALGTVTYDETQLRDVSLKNRGWIERLMVNQTGQAVRRGQILFTLYSPELLSAQEELLAALRSQATASRTEVPDRADYLVEAAKRRLLLWDLSTEQIDAVADSGEPLRYLPIHSPASGYVVEKNVVEGAAVEPGAALYRIAGLHTVWLDAEIYESELPLVEVGQPAEVTFPYLAGRTFRAKVAHIDPFLQIDSRTGTVRLELPNPRLELKPDMYANVVLEVKRGTRVVVPEEAVIYAGPRRIVFVDRGEGRLEPRQVELGIKVTAGYEVLSGLDAGDIVVTSGNFLIAAESRLKSATEQWQ